jgi:hypothetical protein
MTRRILPLLMALALPPLLSPAALAGEVEKAEHTRIGEEMRKLAARNAWSAVEASFKRLEELEKKGEVISYKEFMLGAEAARALGDMTAARARVERASKLDPTKEALDWLADVDANYGRVEISFDNKYSGVRTLVPTSPPFAPDQRASITYAQAQLEAGAGYTGLLPAGEYSVGDSKVTVAVGEKVASLRLGPPAAAPKDAFKFAYLGPRGQVGVAYTLGGAPAEDNDALMPDAFSGAGARLGVGLEVGLTPAFGVIAEVGYHSLFADHVSADGEPDVATDTLHLGYGWLAANLRFGRVWLAAGPIFSVGGGNVTGLASSCLDGCAGYSPDELENPDAQEDIGYTPFRANGMRLGGGAASLSFALVDFGALSGALAVEGGAQTDNTRLYPWGQVAFAVAPSASRRKE